MALLNGIIYTFKAADFPIKLISSFFKMLLLTIPLQGYQVRIAQQVSRGNESGLPPGACGEELGLGLGMTIVDLPLYYLTATYANAVRSVPVYSSSMINDILLNVVLQVAIPIIILGIPSFVIYLRWITTGNFLAAFNLKATWEYIQEYPLQVVSGYIQAQAVYLLIPIILIVGFLLLTQTFLAICGMLLLIPLPFLVRGYIVGKVAQQTKQRAIDRSRDVFQDIDE